MADLTLDEARLLAWHEFACTDTTAPWCGRRVGRRCVNEKGQAVPPHPQRLALAMAMAHGQDSMQPQIDQLTADLAAAKTRLAASDSLVASLRADLVGARADESSLTAQLADVHAQLTKAQADDSLDAAEIARLNAELVSLRAQLGPWKLAYEVDTTDPSQWTINTGLRPTVDASRNSKDMVKFSPDGIVLTMSRVGKEILSCDIVSKRKLGRYRAVQMRASYQGYLGAGMFPCLYWTKGGGGELDGNEFLGGMVGTKADDFQWKMTAIALPATSPLVQVQKQFRTFITEHGIDVSLDNDWRWEHTPGRLEMFINGLSAAVITEAEFDAQGPINGATKKPYWAAKPGRWAAQFEAENSEWYTRHTWQGGPNAEGKGNAGVIPADWQESSFTIHSMSAWEYSPQVA